MSQKKRLEYLRKDLCDIGTTKGAVQTEELEHNYVCWIWPIDWNLTDTIVKIAFSGHAVEYQIFHQTYTRQQLLDLPVDAPPISGVPRQMLHEQDQEWMSGYRLRNYLRRTQDGFCYLCGAKLRTRDITVDHVKPTSKGGTHTTDNLKGACWSCNNAKADKPLNVYLDETNRTSS